MKKNFKNLLVLSFLGISVVGCNKNLPSTSITPTNSSITQNNSSSSITQTTSSSSQNNDDTVTITSMSITGSYKTEYLIGEELDLTGIKLAVSYSDGTKETIDVTLDMITPVDMILLVLRKS